MSEPPTTYFLETLGCPKNQVDSDKLEGVLTADGMQRVTSADKADMVVVNKADGDLKTVATRAVAEYRMALQLIRQRSEHWSVPVAACSALNDEGIDEGLRVIQDYESIMRSHGEIARRRSSQAKAWMDTEINDVLGGKFRDDPSVKKNLASIEASVLDGSLPPTTAAQRLLNLFFKAT